MPWSRILPVAAVGLVLVGGGLCLLLCGGAESVDGELPAALPEPSHQQPAPVPGREPGVAAGEDPGGLDLSPLDPGVPAASGPTSSEADSESGDDAVPAEPGAAPADEQPRDDGDEPAEVEPIVYAPTKDGIDAAVRAGLDSLRSCYQAWLGDDPDLGGRILVSFTIRPQEDSPKVANVAELGVYDSEFQHLPLEGCTLSVFEEMLFDAPEDGGEIKVRYPIVLSTDEQDSEE